MMIGAGGCDWSKLMHSDPVTSPAPAPSLVLCVHSNIICIAAAISSSVTITMRDTPAHIISSALSSGVLQAMPSANRVVTGAEMTLRATNESA
ncbi:MAG: hypothetical protein ACI81O_001313 [Cyclobacteriaceae bacterium]|jgi:hypothetical protein